MGPLGKIDSLLIAEQALDETFQFFCAGAAQATEVIRLRLDGHSYQTERLSF